MKSTLTLSSRPFAFLLALVVLMGAPALFAEEPSATAQVAAPAAAGESAVELLFTPVPSESEPDLWAVPEAFAAGPGGYCPEDWTYCDQEICTGCCIFWGGSGGICAGGLSCFCWW